MHWHDDYRRKCLSAQEAVRLINSGDRLFTSGNVATPRVLLRALVERLEHKKYVNKFYGVNQKVPEHTPALRSRSRGGRAKMS